MNDIFEMIDSAIQEKTANQQPRMPKEEYAEMMNQKRQELYNKVSQQIDVIKINPQQYIHYLYMQAKLDYTVSNTLLIMSQKPDATMLKDSNHWRENKQYIKKGEKGIQILEPAGEFQKEDGTMGTNYKIKYVFDVSQLGNKVNLDLSPKVPIRDLISGLIYASNVRIQKSDTMMSREDVLYSPESSTIFYKNNIDGSSFLQGLVREICYVEFNKQYGNINRERDGFIVESSAYMLCQKYNISADDKNFANKVSQYFYGMSEQDIKEELSNAKNLSDDVSKRIERGIYKTQQEKVNTQNHNIGR